MAVAIYYIFRIINWIIWLYSICVVIDAIMSWLPLLRDSVVGRWLNKIVKPYLDLFRRGPIQRLAFSTGIDISSIIALLVLYFIQDYALRWLLNIIFKIVF